MRHCLLGAAAHCPLCVIHRVHVSPPMTLSDVKAHPTAVIDPAAEIADGVEIGAYAVIGPHVHIGAGTMIGNHCVVEGDTTIGERCQIFTGVVLGSAPQDLKYQGEPCQLIVGSDNKIREYVTINPGTEGGGGVTRIGEGNLLMAYAHVGHDCDVGDRCIIANVATLGGHVILQDGAIVGGLSAVHQFARVGRLAIVGGCSKVTQDIPPFALCDGHPARIYGLNLEGLKRGNISSEARNRLHGAFRRLFHSGLSQSHALRLVREEVDGSPEVDELLAFVESSERGLCRGRRSVSEE